MPTPSDKRYLEGIALFNKREFYEAHEIWEDLWHEEHGVANHFIQGLIQFATALHHFESANLKGAKLLYEGGVELLDPYGEEFWNLPVKKLIDDMRECMKEVLPYQQRDLPGRYHPDKDQFPVKLEPEKIPTLQLKSQKAV